MNHPSKLRAVIRHEFLTIIRQPSFWIMLVALPLIIAAVVLIGTLTDGDANKDIDLNKEQTSIAVIDNSRVIDPEVLRSYDIDLRQTSERASLENQVKNGSLDGLIVYPNDLAKTGNYQMYADNTDTDNAAVVQEAGRIILQQSLLAPLDSEALGALAISGGEGTIQTYTDGKPAREFPEYIVPGAFLVLFYIVLVFSVGYALSSVSEEKENRSIEMVLSYVRPQTLILGKLLAIILVTLVQIAFFATLGVVAYLLMRLLGNSISLPLDLSDLTFVPVELLIGFGFLVFGFIFYVGLMATIGAIFPSSKEANGFSTVFFILPAIPFWGIQSITNQADSTFTQILTYFPLTSPTSVLIRNAAGNLNSVEGLVSLAILVASTIAVVFIAAKAFRLGTLEYSDRIKLGALLKK